ncbi:MAG: ADP-glyceromanno-heptose 6-epimerase [Gemmatimonadaceae bacterium]
MNSSSHSRVLVTGGAGFIGSQLIAELNRRGVSDIVVADFLASDEKWRNLVPLSFTDYTDAGDLIAAMRAGTLGSFDLVLHMGACSSTTETDAAYLMRNNYQFTRDLAELSLAAGARFVYASSAATYGDGSAGMDDSSDINYLESLRPLNMYGYSKHLFDLHAARTGLLDQCAGVKYFNVFGPNEQHKGDMRSLVNKAFTQVRETGDIRLFRSYRDDIADGEQRRDFIYINDAVAMTLFLADHKAANGLFNAGSGRAETWVELANAVFAAMGKKPSIQFIDMPEAIRAKYQYFTQANIGRLRAAGYEQEVTPLTDAVSDYVTNYLTP